MTAGRMRAGQLQALPRTLTHRKARQRNFLYRCLMMLDSIKSRSRWRPLLALGLLLFSATGLAAADVKKGAAIAQRWCASCHLIAPGQTTATADAPSFAAISAARKIPEVTGFLLQSHPSMPDMNLTRSEISDLIAYMQSLAPPLDPIKPPPQKDEAPKQFRG